MKFTWQRLLLVLLLAGCFSFRFYYIGVFQGYWWDECVYLVLARNLYENFAFRTSVGESFRPLMLPLTIALGYKFSYGEATARAIELTFSVLAVLAIFYLGKVCYGESAGLVAASFLASNPLFIFFGQMILTESMFITLFSLSLAFLHLGIEHKPALLPVSAALLGLTCLTKNFGFTIPLFFLLYLVLRGRTALLKSRIAVYSLAAFLLALTPYLFFAWQNYHSLIGPILEQSQNVPPLYAEPAFYLFEFFRVFQLNSLFIILGLVYCLRKREPQDKTLLLSAFYFLTILNTVLWFRKEQRYLVSLYPIFMVTGASVFRKLRGKKVTLILACLALFLSVTSFIQGYQMVMAESTRGAALKEACLYLKGITREGEYVVSPSYPYVEYLAVRPVVKPPPSREDFYAALNEYNVSFILIHYPEPENPSYLSEELDTQRFESVRVFKNISGNEVTAIYRYRGRETSKSQESTIAQTTATFSILLAARCGEYAVRPMAWPMLLR